MYQWLGKYSLLDPEHKYDLERMSAMHELSLGLSRDQSENLAYQKYKRTQLLKAAAYHLDGMECAKARGSMNDGKRHYSMYILHLQALCLNPYDSVSPEIESKRTRNSELFKEFSSHPADNFVLSK